MIRALFLVLAATLVVESAVAQSDNPFNGTWSASLDGVRANDLGGTVLVNGDGGTWELIAWAPKNPCIGRKYPITVQSASVDGLVFTVNRAATLSGCKDSTYTFKKVDDKTLKGELDDGRPISLTRN